MSLDLDPDLIRRMHEIPEALERAMRPYNFATFKELVAIKPIAEAQAEAFEDAIKVTIEGIEANLGEDEELFLYYSSALEFIRVSSIIMPSSNLVVLIGTDAAGNDCRVLAHIQSVQFVCKVVKLQPEQKPKRIGFIIPEQV